MDVDVKDRKGGQTPLYLAIKSKCEESVKLLIGKGADLNVVCFGKSLMDHLSEKLPQVEVSLIPRIKTNLEGYTNGTAMFERLKLLVEKNSLRRSTTYTQDLHEFKAGVGQLVAFARCLEHAGKFDGSSMPHLTLCCMDRHPSQRGPPGRGRQR